MAEAKAKAGMARYLWEAFKFRWNLLLFGGGVVAAVLSPSPDIAIPLVAAAEVAYLAMLSTIPRFQAAIDARSRKGGAAQVDPEDAEKADIEARVKLLEILKGLESERRGRFLRLRTRCVEMQRIANGVRGETHDASGAVEDIRAPALDRLLWAFLRLLLSQQAVERFLSASDMAAVERNLASLEARQKAAQEQKDERILRSVTDAITTARMRLENHAKAKGNFEFLTLELERLEQKIHALMELAVSQHDPDQLSVQVDAVAEGMQQTEATIRELQAITGLGIDDGAAPRIISSELAEVGRS
jgi:hypothetical protein